MTKTVFTPNTDILDILKGSEAPMSFAQIANAMQKRTGKPFKATATITALVKHNYVEVKEVKDVVCPCCGKVTHDVKFYGLK